MGAIMPNFWPILEPSEELTVTNEPFVAKKPGTYRFEDQWIEVVLSSAESTPETISLNEISDSLGGSLNYGRK